MESNTSFNNKYLIFTNLLNELNMPSNSSYRIITFNIADKKLSNKITESLHQHINKYINDFNLLFEVSCPLNNRTIKTHLENVIISNFIKDTIFKYPLEINDILHSLFGKKIDINDSDSFLDKERKAFNLLKNENAIKTFSVNVHKSNLCNKIDFDIMADKIYKLDKPENKLITFEENNSDFYTLLKSNKIDSGLLIILNNILSSSSQSITRKYLVDYSN